MRIAWPSSACLGLHSVGICKEMVHSNVLRLVLNAAIPGLAFATLLTASRSGLLNLFVVFALFAMEGKFSVKRQLHLILVAAVVTFLANDFLSGTHVERLGNIVPGSSIEEKGGGSTENRLNTLIEVSKIVAQNPILGTGIGNVRWVRLQMFGSAHHVLSPHNSYLLVLAEGGILVLVLYLLLFGLTLKYFLDAEKKSKRSEVRLIARSLRIGLIAFLFFTFFADFWFKHCYLCLRGAGDHSQEATGGGIAWQLRSQAKLPAGSGINMTQSKISRPPFLADSFGRGDLISHQDSSKRERLVKEAQDTVAKAYDRRRNAVGLIETFVTPCLPAVDRFLS